MKFNVPPVFRTVPLNRISVILVSQLAILTSFYYGFERESVDVCYLEAGGLT